MSLLFLSEQINEVAYFGKSIFVVIVISFYFCGGLRSITVIYPLSDMQYKYPLFSMIFMYKVGVLTR